MPAPETPAVPLTATPSTHPPRKRTFYFDGWRGVAIVAMTTYLKQRPILRHSVVAAGGAALIGCAIAVSSTKYFVVFIFASFPTFVFWLGGLLAGDEFEIEYGSGSAETKQRIEAEVRVEKAAGKASPQERLDLDAKRLSEYYVINQAQAKSGFRWAIIVMLVGLATIIGGVWLFYLRGPSPNMPLTALSISAGIITDAISGLFLYLNNTTQQLSLRYYDRLVRTQQLSLSIRLSERHETEADRVSTRNKIIDQLLLMAGQPDVASHSSASASANGGRERTPEQAG